MFHPTKSSFIIDELYSWFDFGHEIKKQKQAAPKSEVSKKSTARPQTANPRFDDADLAKRVKGYSREITKLQKQLSRHKLKKKVCTTIKNASKRMIFNKMLFKIQIFRSRLQTDAMANRQVMFSNLQPRAVNIGIMAKSRYKF